MLNIHTINIDGFLICVGLIAIIVVGVKGAMFVVDQLGNNPDRWNFFHNRRRQREQKKKEEIEKIFVAWIQDIMKKHK